MPTAVFTAAPRLAALAFLASTRRMWQFGQMAETISMSSDSSMAHPLLPAARGSGLAIPSWLTFVKQPVPQAGRPQLDR